jgi:hypothetical protein
MHRKSWSEARTKSDSNKKVNRRTIQSYNGTRHNLGLSPSVEFDVSDSDEEAKLESVDESAEALLDVDERPSPEDVPSLEEKDELLDFAETSLFVEAPAAAPLAFLPLARCELPAPAAVPRSNLLPKSLLTDWAWLKKEFGSSISWIWKDGSDAAQGSAIRSYGAARRRMHPRNGKPKSFQSSSRTGGSGLILT